MFSKIIYFVIAFKILQFYDFNAIIPKIDFNNFEIRLIKITIYIMQHVFMMPVHVLLVSAFDSKENNKSIETQKTKQKLNIKYN